MNTETSKAFLYGVEFACGLLGIQRDGLMRRFVQQEAQAVLSRIREGEVSATGKAGKKPAQSARRGSKRRRA